MLELVGETQSKFKVKTIIIPTFRSKPLRMARHRVISTRRTSSLGREQSNLFVYFSLTTNPISGMCSAHEEDPTANQAETNIEVEARPRYPVEAHPWQDIMFQMLASENSV